MKNTPLPRLDEETEIRKQLLKHCRLTAGEIWKDPLGQHKVGCLDATNTAYIRQLMEQDLATLAIHDPPYNLVAFPK